ncbi:Acyl-CoA hydrolase, partial [Scytalidium lignicola]
MKATFLYLLGLGAGLVSAATEYSDDDWANNLDYVLGDLAPLWFFSDGSCYPQAAETNGQQTNGNGASGCLVNNNGLAQGCQDPGSWNGPATRGTSFPTYWTYTDCDDGTRRVCYDIYFRHDSGHESDWEWVCVVLSKDSNDLWFRNGIILEQDNKLPGQTGTPYYPWGDLETFDGQDPTNTNSNGGNHAMIYSAKFHHTMFPNQYTCLGKNNCATDVQQMFRNNDFVWAAADNLAPGDLIDPSWVWGQASSSPSNLNSSVCSFALNGPGYANPPGC